MSSLKEWVNMIFKNPQGQDKTKKAIQNLAIFLGIGIILLLVGGFFDNDNKKVQQVKELQDNKVSQNYLDEYDAALENKIKNILSQIYGVGKVSVAITYLSSKEIVPAQDVKQNETNTNEKDREGGVRSTIQTDTDNKIIIGQQSESKPVILKEIPPQVKGVIVVADGAKDEKVKVDIAKAVSTVLGISLSKIQVFPMASQ